jgi:hypothetical protein
MITGMMGLTAILKKTLSETTPKWKRRQPRYPVEFTHTNANIAVSWLPIEQYKQA